MFVCVFIFVYMFWCQYTSSSLHPPPSFPPLINYYQYNYPFLISFVVLLSLYSFIMIMIIIITIIICFSYIYCLLLPPFVLWAFSGPGALEGLWDWTGLGGWRTRGLGPSRPSFPCWKPAPQTRLTRQTSCRGGSCSLEV